MPADAHNRKLLLSPNLHLSLLLQPHPLLPAELIMAQQLLLAAEEFLVTHTSGLRQAKQVQPPQGLQQEPIPLLSLMQADVQVQLLLLSLPQEDPLPV